MRSALRLTLELEPDSEPISGRLSDDSGDEHAFTGWLGLAAALEAVRGADGRQGRGSPRRRPAQPSQEVER